MKKILFLINPKAGAGKAQDQLYMIVSSLSLYDYEVTVCPIIPARGLTSEKLLARGRGRFDMVLCYGGDGTFSHVVNGYMHEEYQIPLGYIPSGSTNDFARSLGLPNSIGDSINLIVEETPFKIDAGLFNDTYFGYVAAFGAFTEVSYDTNTGVKNAMGHMAYMLRAVTAIPDALTQKYDYKIIHDGIEEEGEYMFGAVSSTKSIGGFRFPGAERVDMCDGVFEVILVKRTKNIMEAQRVISKLLGGSTDDELIESFQTSSIRFETNEDVPWTLDGEFGGNVRNVDISIIEKAIPILVPSNHSNSGN